MDKSTISIHIYGKTKCALDTYKLFSDALVKSFKRKKKRTVELEIDRQMADLDGKHEEHEEPVIVVDGKIASEGRMPSSESVTRLLGQLANATS